MKKILLAIVIMFIFTSMSYASINADVYDIHKVSPTMHTTTHPDEDPLLDFLIPVVSEAPDMVLVIDVVEFYIVDKNIIIGICKSERANIRKCMTFEEIADDYGMKLIFPALNPHSNRFIIYGKEKK